jgi:heterodisulfide reductase subunit A-like polyferredoxin
MNELGGMMRHRIPDSLLEKFVVANEISYIQDLGVNMKCGVEFGKDVNIDTLHNEGYEAIFIAIGKLPENLSLPQGLLNKKQGAFVIPVDPITLETKIHGIFAGGDSIQIKPAGIITAVSTGRQAAVSIHRYLNGQDLKADREECEEITWVKDWKKIDKKPQRYAVKKGEPKLKVSFEEAAETLEKIKSQAMFEAFRCLCCGPCSECISKMDFCEVNKPAIDESICTGCNVCVSICPFGAMSKNEKGVAQVAEETCKGCGICAAHCPENAITIERSTREPIAINATARSGG